METINRNSGVYRLTTACTNVQAALDLCTVQGISIAASSEEALLCFVHQKKRIN